MDPRADTPPDAVAEVVTLAAVLGVGVDRGGLELVGEAAGIEG